MARSGRRGLQAGLIAGAHGRDRLHLGDGPELRLLRLDRGGQRDDDAAPLDQGQEERDRVGREVAFQADDGARRDRGVGEGAAPAGDGVSEKAVPENLVAPDHRVAGVIRAEPLEQKVDIHQPPPRA